MNDKLYISPGNRKLGYIPSVSLNPHTTCSTLVTCKRDCYAIRMMDFRKNIAKSWTRNTTIFEKDPLDFFQQIKTFLNKRTPQYFRWHVGGDIPDAGYFLQMLSVARLTSNTKFLAFTKKFSVVRNNLRDIQYEKNMRTLLSAWPKEVPSQSKELMDTMNMSRGMIERVGVAWVDNDPRWATLGVNTYTCTNNCSTCYMCWTSAGDVLLHKH